MGQVEIRGFGDLMNLFNKRKWPFPLLVAIEQDTTTGELAKMLDIPFDKIEIIFVNGKAQGTDFPVKHGDRVAFVPPGTPGPYRVLLGFIKKDNGK